MRNVIVSPRTEDYHYELPAGRIAQAPVEPRDASKLMLVYRRDGSIDHRRFRDIVDYLRPGDLLVCNESRVIPARLNGRKVGTGGQVEALLVSRQGPCVWEALVRPGRRLREGSIVEFVKPGSDGADKQAQVTGTIYGRTPSGGRLVEFTCEGDVDKRLEELGVVPLPPYVHLPLDDPERYQTVYARVKGSVAAPTAGLHFTPDLLERIRSRGVDFAFVTLHIGLDTFRPVQVENVAEHKMHSEYCELTDVVSAQLNAARREGRRIIAIGTTSVRALESAAQAAARAGATEVFTPFRGWTDIFIYPGYRFRAVDALVTNFHLPRSTLLMLVSAFAGKDLIDRAYATAVAEDYRFFSFGDAMLLI
ncbi:MAG: tRNA preQ1(34) S-adenosylmethionine ribosyltransferase-isomerase QueA [Chloroflexi bacterium]|nr:tRNA preQ1(34) S-adenosylmethionine ribosyltransferase-isomerase QueA [Chloroflexota bacterium]